MAKNKSDSPVVYEAANHELKTRKDYFAQIDKPVIGIEWENGIAVGAEIKPGQLLAKIVWDDATKTPIVAPSKCKGRIEWKNGKIEYESLHLQSQVLLRLVARKKVGRRMRRASNNVNGTLVEEYLRKGEKTAKLNVTQAKSKIKVFICYAKEDLSVAQQIYKRLKGEGHDPWVDEEKLVGGQDWQMEITKAIEESDFFLACLSSHSVTKDGYVQKELKKGMDIFGKQPEGRIYLIPVRLEDCEVPIKLRERHWVDLFKRDGLKKLLKAIETGCEQRRAFR